MKLTCATDGTRYEVLYALRKEGAVKNDLITDSIDKIIEYLSNAHRCKPEDIKTEPPSPPPSPSL